jgi:hypothetical protein
MYFIFIELNEPKYVNSIRHDINLSIIYITKFYLKSYNKSNDILTTNSITYFEFIHIMTVNNRLLI